MEKWFQYDYVCSICDALIEYTTKSNIYKPFACCGQVATWLSVVDATIPSKNPAPTKEIEMETETTELIDNGILYQQLKQMKDTNATQTSTIRTLLSKIDIVDNIITEQFEDSNDQETLTRIATALDIALIKEVTWSATVTITGTMEIDITEEYDLESRVYDELSGELYNYDISIDNVEER